jgi:hypothetical protein
MVGSEWAKRTAEEFKEGKARTAEDGVRLQEDPTARRESASRSWTEVGEAFKDKARMFDAAREDARSSRLSVRIGRAFRTSP